MTHVKGKPMAKKGSQSKYVAEINRGMIKSVCWLTPEENELVKRVAHDARVTKTLLMRTLVLEYCREKYKNDPTSKGFTPPGLR